MKMRTTVMVEIEDLVCTARVRDVVYRWQVRAVGKIGGIEKNLLIQGGIVMVDSGKAPSPLRGEILGFLGDSDTEKLDLMSRHLMSEYELELDREKAEEWEAYLESRRRRSAKSDFVEMEVDTQIQ